MAYIVPNSKIYILKDVPLDNTYENTVIWYGVPGETPMSQYNYFISKSKYQLDYNSYQRVNSNAIRIQMPVDALYDCNYLMFNNTSYTGKWFYAFITDIEYVNNAVSIVYYEIDVMQTWVAGIDYGTGKWFVEREHSLHDYIFENTQPENVELGTDTIKTLMQTYDMNDLIYCILCTKYHDGSSPHTTTENNIWSSLGVIVGVGADPTNPDNILQQFIDNGYEDAIVSAYMIPARFAPPNVNMTEGGAHFRRDVVSIPFELGNLNGYTPKNKKLYTYPYCFMTVSNNNGETANYKLENFNSHYISQDGVTDTISFYADGAYSPTVNSITYPVDYLGIHENKDEGITLNNFPACAFSGDAYKAWIAQNRGSLISNGINSTLASFISGGFTLTGDISGSVRSNAREGTEAYQNIYPYSSGSIFGYESEGKSRNTSMAARLGHTLNVNPISAGVTAMSAVGSAIAKKRDLQNTPPNMHGQLTNECLNAGSKRYKYSYYKTCIKAEYAKIIDNYFDMFGYATNQVKAPNIGTRPHWNYVKTANAYVHGDMPQDAANKIASIFNKGITFWKSPLEVGMYNLDNSPQS